MKSRRFIFFPSF